MSKDTRILAMKTREEVARFVERQFGLFGPYSCKFEKGYQWHYGKQEARELMDFIYGGEPASDDQKVSGKQPRTWHKA